MSQHSPLLIVALRSDNCNSFSSSQQTGLVITAALSVFLEQQSSIIAKETLPFPLLIHTIELMVKPKLLKRKITAKKTAVIF